jgi:hypothetical protein
VLVDLDLEAVRIAEHERPAEGLVGDPAGKRRGVGEAFERLGVTSKPRPS